jgi:hypothetical protein
VLVTFEFDVVALVLFGSFKHCTMFSQLIINHLLVGIFAVQVVAIPYYFGLEMVSVTAEVGPILLVYIAGGRSPKHVKTRLLTYDQILH